jgi:hypothetical protein
MAWRPSRFLLEGELDNTTLGKVVGWMKFAGMTCKVTFDLVGNFHRDIRGAKVRFKGDGKDDDPEAPSYMKGFTCHQSGKVGDMTGGLPPVDYSTTPYLEWYSEENGRVVVEVEPQQLKVLGRPIPACESDPISREEQNRNMAEFLSGLSREMQCPVLVMGKCPPPVSDPKFTHWVVEGGQVVGEAHSVEPSQHGVSFAFVRLFAMPEMAEFGSIESENLRPKVPSHKKESRR